jgi:hypothetical protein
MLANPPAPWLKPPRKLIAKVQETLVKLSERSIPRLRKVT